MRADGRRPDELRPLDLQPDFLEQPHGSILWAQGRTVVLCTASIQDGVPRWLYGKGRGWLTAEYAIKALGDRTVWLDCDVLQADGGTRCASICGAYVAARRALDRFGLARALPQSIGAVSVGVVDGVPLLDLDYSEDRRAETDMNVVMTGDGRLVEVQATAEAQPFTRQELDALLDLAGAGIEEIELAQRAAVEEALA
jgi:ribonuclease PH